MGRNDLQLTLSISYLFLLLISGFASLNPSKPYLGIDPKDDNYYHSNVIRCKDGSKQFTREQLNDDFCDCPDGTDEPGTSACPEGKFYCRNAGHIPITIFSSRVNDGLCDCCDGSDEHDGTVNCSNKCWEAGKAAREKLNKKIKTYQGGVIIRKQDVEKAKQAFARDEEDLAKLKSEEKILKELVDKLKDHKERIEKAEAEERLKKEKEEKRLEAERKAQEKDEAPDKVPNDSTDVDNAESPKQVSKEGHDVASEAEKDHSSEPELSVNHDVELHEVEDHNDIYKSETADHSRTDKESPGDIANPVQNVAEDHDDTFLEDGSFDDSEKDKSDSSHARKEYIFLEDHDDTFLEDGSFDDSEKDKSDSSHARKEEQVGSDDTSALSKEELGRLVASRWTGEDAARKTDEADNTVMDEEHQDTPHTANEEDDHGYNSATDDDRRKYDDDDFEDDVDEEYPDDNVESEHAESDGSYNHDENYKHEYSDFTDSSSSSWLDKIKQTVQNVLSSFSFLKTPVDLSEADRVRKEYDDSKSKLSTVQSRISSLTAKLKHDFGKEKEFYSFYDRCFESKQNKYVYKVCPFKQASQVEGHSTTRLGNWEKFEESYREMQFSNGERCWNGPDRSIKVRLRCGLATELTDVDEPSRCEYVAMLSTPLLCTEDKLKELQQKLEQMNSKLPQSHDEL